MKWWVIGVCAVAVGLIALGIWSEISWARYAAKHHCYEVARREGYYYPQYMYDGKGNITGFFMQYSGDVITYQCDNGMVTR
jgi:hypothetical protein